jgi:glycosyltransferase involved in cell wall biosynthesis
MRIAESTSEVQAAAGRKPPMVVCLMNDNFYRSSGAAIAIKRIALALRGVDYCVAGCDPGDLAEDLEWIPAGKYMRFDLKSANPLRVVRELRRMKQWLKAQGCELVHCHHRRVSVLLQLFGIPVLYTGQLVFPEAWWFRLLRPRMMTAITPSVAQNLFETTGNKTLACIGNPACFPEQPPPIDLPAVKNRAVCIARLDEVKAHRHLLAAWKLLYDRGHRYELDLIGEGPLRHQLEAQSLANGTQDLIHFCGFTSDVSIPISRSLFAILLSEIEGQGIVTLEAAAMGRASLLTAVPGSVDLIPPQHTLENGLEFGNVEQTADALEQWFAHPEQVLEEGRLFFDFLKAVAEPQAVAKAYTEVYQTVLMAAR